jgi:hypothetical protein
MILANPSYAIDVSGDDTVLGRIITYLPSGG